jgi:hypothetical protein
MTSAVSALYEPLIARDVEGVERAVRRFRETGSSHELYLAVGRFAVLSFAPSQHARHAVLATLSAWELRNACGERWDDLLVEVARYAASSRQPWSEPPIPDPPDVDPATPSDLDELRAAIRDRDRLRGERWLAQNLGRQSLARALALVSFEDLSDLGHKVILTNAALKLISILGEKGQYVALRMAIWELTAQAGEAQDPAPAVDTSERALRKLVDRCVAESGSLESAHAVFLFDAALELRERVDGKTVIQSSTASQAPPVYRLGRDMGALLKAHAVAMRLRSRFSTVPVDSFVRAVNQNLDTAPSLEEWSFA